MQRQLLAKWQHTVWLALMTGETRDVAINFAIGGGLRLGMDENLAMDLAINARGVQSPDDLTRARAPCHASRSATARACTPH